jgi:hypothetical protein
MLKKKTGVPKELETPLRKPARLKAWVHRKGIKPKKKEKSK